MELSKVRIKLLLDGSNQTSNISVLTIWLGVTLASQRAIGRGYAAALMFIPAFVGAVLVNTLASHHKVGLLVSYWISSESSSRLVIKFTHASNSFCIYTICDTSGMGWIYSSWPHKAYVYYSFISAL
jgi:hypothetical protein